MDASKHYGLSKQELVKRVGGMDQLAGVKLVEAADGLARGCRQFHVWTGSGLAFDVQADRTLDITACRYKGIPVAWASSVGEVHPAYYDPAGQGWLRSFAGGLLATCGLDQWGPPNVDKGEELGQHGRVSNLPARYVSYNAGWVGDDYEIEISGEVRQTRVFGENLVLRRRITTRLGSSAIRIADVVTNEGFAPHPHMILYHFNLGFPLLSEDAQLLVDAAETTPRDPEAAAGAAAWMRFQPPTPGYQEQVFLHQPRADEAGKVLVEVRNPVLGLGLRLRYDSASLPYLLEWKMMGEGMYVLGVEPANSGVMEGRAAARAADALPLLEPGESRAYELIVEIVEYA
jgi:hypothetical protein